MALYPMCAAAAKPADGIRRQKRCPN